MAWSPVVGWTAGREGPDAPRGVCLAEEWLRLTPGSLRRSGLERDCDVGGMDVHARSMHAAAIDVLSGELTRAPFGPGLDAPPA